MSEQLHRAAPHVGRAFKLVMAFAVLVLGGGRASAQWYTFQLDSAAYEPLPGVVLPFANSGDPEILRIDFQGQPFSFFGRRYVINSDHQLSILATGTIRVDDSATGLGLLGLSSNDFRCVGDNAGIRINGMGGPGNLILQFEWSNVSVGGAANAPVTSFQIWIYQQSGVVEYRYGPSTGPDSAYGAGLASALLQLSGDASAMLGKASIAGDPQAPRIDSSLEFFLPRIAHPPRNGTIYRFIPGAASGVDRDHASTELAAAAWPNPTSGRVSIRLAGPDSDITVFDALGRLVASMAGVSGDHAVVDLTAQPAGLYRVVATSGARHAACLVVKR